MNGDPLDVVAPRFRVGVWDRLSGQQRRVFATYAAAKFGEAAADPMNFARGLWNESAAGAGRSDELGGTPAAARNVYAVERGLFVVQSVKEGGR